MVDTSDAWIVERTGIKERHIASESEATSDVAFPAAQRALSQAGLSADDLDVILCATVTGDHPWPSLACKLQSLLEAKNAFAFDISAACSGWIYGLGVTQSLIATGRAKHVLVVGAELLSRIVDWTDRTTCVLFGDGAGATVLGPSTTERALLSCCLASDGDRYELLYQPAGGTRFPASAATVAERMHVVRMEGKEVFKYAVRNMADLAKRAISEAGFTVDDIDLFIPHQANLRIIDQTSHRVGIPMDRVYINVDRYGNTSAASIPIALDEARELGRISENTVVCVAAFGGGFTYGAAVLRM
jgi:3-oxoacyl-[acyl-carrier-protein] synthase-3